MISRGGKDVSISPMVIQSLDVIKESVLEFGIEATQMHTSFDTQIDLLTKMYEKQQADYAHFREELQQNLSVISKRIDSRLFNISPAVVEQPEAQPV